MVAEWLPPPADEIFFAQADSDQRHGLEAGLSVLAEGVEEPRAIQAALLHDVGKRHSGLSVFGRSVASVAIILGIPMTRRMRMYRDHGDLAARELEMLGFGGLITDFARHHHGRRPASISLSTWNTLQRADRLTKPDARSTR